MNQFELNEKTGKYSVAGQVSAKAIIDQALQILDRSLRRGARAAFTSPDGVRQFVRLHLAKREREVFAVMFLDNRHRLLAYEELFFGTIDGASVHPREVVKAALAHNAAAVILSHNHPSGVAEPSQADQRITQRLKDALGLVDVRVLDHLIVGEGEPVSFAERGLL